MYIYIFNFNAIFMHKVSFGRSLGRVGRVYCGLCVPGCELGTGRAGPGAAGGGRGAETRGRPCRSAARRSLQLRPVLAVMLVTFSLAVAAQSRYTWGGLKI